MRKVGFSQLSCNGGIEMPVHKLGFEVKSGVIAYGPGAGVRAVGLEVDASPGSWLEGGLAEDFNKIYNQILEGYPGYKHIVVSEETDFDRMTKFICERFFRFLLEAPRQFQFILRTRGVNNIKLPGTKVHLSLQIEDKIPLGSLLDRADSLCIYWDPETGLSDEFLLCVKGFVSARHRDVYLVLASLRGEYGLGYAADKTLFGAGTKFCKENPEFRLSVPLWREFV